MNIQSHDNSGVALQGNIAAIELENIFQFFNLTNASGGLRIINKENNASFFFQDGMLIFGALNTNQKRVGELLLESNRINASQLTRCLEIHARLGKKRRLGEILVKKGFVDFERLVEMLKQQAREAFYTTLTWKQGMFYFCVNQQPSPEEILINDRIDQLLLEGLIRIDELSAMNAVAKS